MDGRTSHIVHTNNSASLLAVRHQIQKESHCCPMHCQSRPQNYHLIPWSHAEHKEIGPSGEAAHRDVIFVDFSVCSLFFSCKTESHGPFSYSTGRTER